jgi:hypothetical protein
MGEAPIFLCDVHLGFGWGMPTSSARPFAPALGKIRLSWVFSVFLVTGKLLGKRAILFGPRIAIRQSDQQCNQLTLPPSAGLEKNALELRAHGFPSDTAPIRRLR